MVIYSIHGITYKVTVCISVYCLHKTSINMDHIYKKPKTLYERFVNAYCQYEKRFCSREDLVKAATLKWKEMKSNEAEVNVYISVSFYFI